MKFETLELLVPSHWLSAIVNGDESSFDYYDDPQDYKAYKAFLENEIGNNTLSVDDEEGSFCHYHDASPYGVLPCDCHRCTLLIPA